MSVLSKARQVSASSESLFALMEEEVDSNREGESSDNDLRLKGDIVFHDVDFSYPARTQVVDASCFCA